MGRRHGNLEEGMGISKKESGRRKLSRSVTKKNTGERGKTTHMPDRTLSILLEKYSDRE